jgi:hypothetical protein
MEATEVIRAALKTRGMLQKELAAAMGLTPQGLNRRLVNNTLSAQEFFDAIGLLDMTVRISDKDTGETVRTSPFKPGVLPRVSMVVEGTRYDTANADALCHTDERDGLTMELYKDYRGCYFVVICAHWEGGKPYISPCDEAFSLRLYEAYRDVSDPPPWELFSKELCASIL